jgi:hypothetical protein
MMMVVSSTHFIVHTYQSFFLMGTKWFRHGRKENEDNAATVKVVRIYVQRSKKLNANDSIFDYADVA